MATLRGSALNLKGSILDRFHAQSGRVWTPVDFLDLGPRAAVDKALQRLAAQKTITRIDRGLYHFPGHNSLTGKPTVLESGTCRVVGRSTVIAADIHANS